MSNLTLKLLALFFMTIDHIGATFLLNTPYYTLSRAIGRLSFPIFLFLIIEGYKKTSNVKKYILSLYIFAIISMIPFKLAFGSSYYNVFFTLGTVVLMLHIFDVISNKHNSGTYEMLIFITFALIALILGFDWGIQAIVTSFVLRSFIYDNKILAVSIPITLFITVAFTFMVGVPLDIFFNVFIQVSPFCLPILFTIPLLLNYNGKRGLLLKGYKKYLFYFYYPLHLLIIGILLIILKLQ